MTDEPPSFPFARLENFVFQFKRRRYTSASLVRHAAQRDGDVCWYCGLAFVRFSKSDTKVKRRTMHTEPFKRSLEHFVPRARLTAHTPETTCIAHAMCNERAGDHGEEFRYALRARYRENPELVIEMADLRRSKSLEKAERKRSGRRRVIAKSNEELHAEMVRRLARAAPPAPPQMPLEQPTTPLTSPGHGSDTLAPLPCVD